MFYIKTMLYLDPSDYNTHTRGVYKKIVTIAPQPPSSHPLYKYTRQIHTTKLSGFKEDFKPMCISAFTSLLNPTNLMTYEEIPDLFIKFAEYNLNIHEPMTNIFSQQKNNEIVCFIN